MEKKAGLKLVAVDMDGTLLSERLEISEENVRAIHQAQRQGIIIAIATGRPYAWVRRKLEEVRLQCPVIGTNGAETFLEDGSLVHTAPISASRFLELREMLEREKLYYEVYTSKGVLTDNLEGAIAFRLIGVQRKSPDMPLHEAQQIAEARFARSGIAAVTGLEAMLRDPSVQIYKVLAASYDIEKLQRIKAGLAALSGLSVSSSDFNNLEISHEEANKGLALRRLAKLLAIPVEETAAIGDNLNDMAMLEAAGLAIAMGNAVDAVKRACRYTTLSNEEHGVAYAICRYCL